MRFLLVLLAVLLVGVSPVASQVPDDKMVVPGARIGRWTLDTPIPELLRMNGPSSARASIVAAIIPGATWYSWDTLGLAAGTHDRRQTAYLALYEERDYTVPRGIGIRASRNAVLAAHGEPTLETDLFVQGRTITLLAYDRSGLAFFMDNDIVQVLLIFYPGGLQHLIVIC